MHAVLITERRCPGQNKIKWRSQDKDINAHGIQLLVTKPKASIARSTYIFHAILQRHIAAIDLQVR
jgi:hypothetical protein